MAEVILPPEETEPVIPEEQLPEVEKPTEKSKVISVDFNPLNTKQTTSLDTRESFFTTDTDAWIVLNVGDMNEPTGQYSLALINKEDGSIFQRVGDIVQGVAYYKLLPNEIKHAGRWVGQAVITLDNGQTTASRFSFNVSGHILDGKDVREIVVQDFQTLMKQLNDLKDNSTNEFGLLKNEIEAFQTTIQENEDERQATESERVAAEIIREENYESKVTAAIVEADVVEKVDNKVAELAPTIQQVTAQLARTVKHNENESITNAMLSTEIKTSLNNGVWDFNMNTSEIENGAVTRIKTSSDIQKVLPVYIPKNTSSNSDISFAVTDDNGYVSDLEIDSTGHFSQRVIDILKKRITDQEENAREFDIMSKSDLHEITCWGESTTEGGSPGLSFPAVLQTLVSDRTNVTNRGWSGQCSGIIAARMGSNIVTVTVLGGLIPAEAVPVNINVTVSTGNIKNFNHGNFTCTINGVLGTIQANGTTSTTFTRTNIGSAVNVTGEVIAISTQLGHENDVSVIWVGRNDMAFSWPYMITGVIENVEGMVDYLKPQLKRFIIMSVPTTSEEIKGTKGHTWVNEVNELLQSKYPNNFLDIRRYLIDFGLQDAGITPTQADLTAIENDIIPISLMHDDIHPNAKGKELIANQVYKFSNTRGWIL